MTVQDHEANIAGETKECSSTVFFLIFFFFFDLINKMAHHLSPTGSVAV